jgi:hypothetical protein
MPTQFENYNDSKDQLLSESRKQFQNVTQLLQDSNDLFMTISMIPINYPNLNTIIQNGIYGDIEKIQSSSSEIYNSIFKFRSFVQMRLNFDNIEQCSKELLNFAEIVESQTQDVQSCIQALNVILSSEMCFDQTSTDEDFIFEEFNNYYKVVNDMIKQYGLRDRNFTPIHNQRNITVNDPSIKSYELINNYYKAINNLIEWYKFINHDYITMISVLIYSSICLNLSNMTHFKYPFDKG